MSMMLPLHPMYATSSIRHSSWTYDDAAYGMDIDHQQTWPADRSQSYFDDDPSSISSSNHLGLRFDPQLRSLPPSLSFYRTISTHDEDRRASPPSALTASHPRVEAPFWNACRGYFVARHHDPYAQAHTVEIPLFIDPREPVGISTLPPRSSPPPSLPRQRLCSLPAEQYADADEGNQPSAFPGHAGVIHAQQSWQHAAQSQSWTQPAPQCAFGWPLQQQQPPSAWTYSSIPSSLISTLPPPEPHGRCDDSVSGGDNYINKEVGFSSQQPFLLPQTNKRRSPPPSLPVPPQLAPPTTTLLPLTTNLAPSHHDHPSASSTSGSILSSAPPSPSSSPTFPRISLPVPPALQPMLDDTDTYSTVKTRARKQPERYSDLSKRKRSLRLVSRSAAAMAAEPLEEQMQDAVESEELEAVAPAPVVSASSPAEEHNGDTRELESEEEEEKEEDESPRGRRKVKSRRVSSTSSGSQNRLLPPGMTEALTEWYEARPVAKRYPDREQKIAWSKRFKCSYLQIDNWFINRRRRQKVRSLSSQFQQIAEKNQQMADPEDEDEEDDQEWEDTRKQKRRRR